MSLFACQTLAVTLECRLHFCCFSCLRGLQFNLLIAKTSDIDRPLKAEVQRPTAHPCEHVHYDAFGPPTINPSSSPSSTGYCWCFCCFCRGCCCCPLLCGWWTRCHTVRLCLSQGFLSLPPTLSGCYTHVGCRYIHSLLSAPLCCFGTAGKSWWARNPIRPDFDTRPLGIFVRN